LQADGGKVLIDDAPIQMLGLENYRNQIGVVLQDDQLFSGSIADNISFFAEKLDREHMENCARIASIYDDISDMPMGFNTLVGDMGTVLSGGQKQRVLLARALYRRPGLLLLDEATSHLDTDNERRINEGMAQLDITRVVVAHRRDTIAAADRIITLADGEIVEDEGETGIAV
jgi:ATP-binding cassette subfamily B protein RaxB